MSAIQIVDVLTPTTADPNLCCCRVTGTVTNGNEVAVHVTIKWAAFESREAVEPFARILHFIDNLQPSEVRAFATPNNGLGASGFLVPCPSIAVLRREVDVNGLAFPAGP